MNNRVDSNSGVERSGGGTLYVGPRRGDAAGSATVADFTKTTLRQGKAFFRIDPFLLKEIGRFEAKNSARNRICLIFGEAKSTDT